MLLECLLLSLVAAVCCSGKPVGYFKQFAREVSVIIITYFLEEMRAARAVAERESRVREVDITMQIHSSGESILNSRFFASYASPHYASNIGGRRPRLTLRARFCSQATCSQSTITTGATILGGNIRTHFSHVRSHAFPNQPLVCFINGGFQRNAL